jgi:thioredoxin 1
MYLSTADFRSLIETKQNMIVIFSAPWCKPCKIMDTKMIEEGYNKPNVYKINVDENKEIPVEYKIQALPTTLFFKDGELVKKQEGVIKDFTIFNIINKDTL